MDWSTSIALCRRQAGSPSWSGTVLHPDPPGILTIALTGLLFLEHALENKLKIATVDR